MIAKHILRAAHLMGLMVGISIIWNTNANGQSIHPPICPPLPNPSQVLTSFELHAISDPATGKGAFVFEGHEVPPVIRAVPGGAIQSEYVNQMSKSSSEIWVDGPCMNMTNLHFPGLHVSPDAPGRTSTPVPAADDGQAAALASAQQTAHILGLDSSMQKLLQLQTEREANTPLTAEERSLRLELLESIQIANLDIDGVLGEITNERNQLSDIRTSLQSRRDKSVGRLTTAALITGSGVGIAVNASQYTLAPG
jgi:hypothetical protein